MTEGQLERPRRCLSGPFWLAARDNGVVDNTEAIRLLRDARDLIDQALDKLGASRAGFR